MNKKVEILTKRLIDSVWTIVALVDEESKTAEILQYSRELSIGYQNEDKCRQADLGEDLNRIVLYMNILKGTINREIVESYKVLNPKHIFSYS